MWWPQAHSKFAGASHAPKRKAQADDYDQVVKGVQNLALHANENI